MTDEIDRAQAREAELRGDALAERARRADDQAGRVAAEDCVRCGETIPLARRRAVAGVQTCVDCQRELERLGTLEGVGGC